MAGCNRLCIGLVCLCRGIMSERIDPQHAKDIGWREAARALSRLPHSRRQMSSLNSCPPLRLWHCPSCQATEYSTGTAGPWCYGGYGD
jgi:hypothetical protein